MATARSPKVVVIGGGTGSFAVLSSLKYYVRDLTAVVNMVDDGGSTGQLRDDLGVLPPGDVRQCLVALSESSETMRDLFNYRFGEGSLHGHSFGNLFLTALEKTTGSFATAVQMASQVLNITGRVVPVTLKHTDLVLARPDGATLVGQHTVELADFGGQRPELSLKPQAKLNPAAGRAITEADLVVIAPGNLYASLAPALIVQGMAEALAATSAKVIYVANLVTKPGQTDGYQVHDYVDELERLTTPGLIDYVLYNSHQPSPQLLKAYAQAGEYAVAVDAQHLAAASYEAIGEDLVSDTIPKLSAADKLIPRTLIRHDGDKVARLIMRIYFS
ncbi:MAG TPA: gluconeogenesis factor YvcK family protein [Candidatus Saccharimonadia bacterium]|nr:gluconeogenesis factor YvcK family protein [Candidatus Saccharimonadia bacterium]